MIEVPPDPIQELLAAARRAQILDAATRVFAEKGLHRATIRDVARAAGVEDGTIYTYFDNKDALLIGILARVNESQRRTADFAQAAEATPRTFIRSYTARRLSHLTAANLDVLRVMLSELLVSPALAQRYFAEVVAPTFTISEQPFAAWAQSGQVQTRDPRLATRAMAGMVLGLLLLAGHETTANLIGNSAHALIAHPEQRERLRQRPELIKPALEELARYASPVIMATERYAREDLELGGVSVPRGGLVLAVLASANRDARQFADPDQLDLAREPNHHLAFGQGMHYCLGAPLARLETQIALAALLARLSELRASAPDRTLRWRPGLFVRSLEQLPLSLA